MRDRNDGREQEGNQPPQPERKPGDPAGEGGSFRGQGSYGYQGGYDEEGEEQEKGNDQPAASRSGFETGYQGGQGGEYPNYGDEGSFGGASDQRSAYGPTSGVRDRDKK